MQEKLIKIHANCYSIVLFQVGFRFAVFGLRFLISLFVSLSLSVSVSLTVSLPLSAPALTPALVYPPLSLRFCFPFCFRFSFSFSFRSRSHSRSPKKPPCNREASSYRRADLNCRPPRRISIRFIPSPILQKLADFIPTVVRGKSLST